MTALKVLVIDHDPTEAATTQAYLSDSEPGRFESAWRSSVNDFAHDKPRHDYDVIVIDIDLGRDNNNVLDLALLCRQYAPHSTVVVFTTQNTPQFGIQAMKAGAEDYLVKGDSEPENFAWSILRAHERRKLKNALAQERALFSAILDNMADGVASADTEGNLTFFNRAASNLAGIGITDSTPDSWQERYGMYRADSHTPYPAQETPLYKAINGQAVNNEHLIVRHAKLPQGRMLSLSGRPLLDESGRLVGGVVSFREVKTSDQN